MTIIMTIRQFMDNQYMYLPQTVKNISDRFENSIMILANNLTTKPLLWLFT